MGKVLKFVGGAILVASAFAIPGIGLVAGGALKTALITAGFGLASSVLPSGIRAKQGIETNIADPLASLPVVYGKAKVGLRLVDVREDPATGNRELWVVGALCHGSEGGGGILSIDEVFFNGKLAINAAGTVQAPFTGKVSFAKLLGTDAQNWSTTSVGGNTLNGKFSTAWPTTSMGKGVAGLILRLTYDQEVFASGIPQVTAVVHGNLVTDVRTGGTAYSTNPALCLHDYLRSTRYGMRLPSGEVDGGTTASFATMANYYDEDVTITGPGTTQDRFTCNGWLDTAAQPAENIRQLLTSCRGNLVYTGGLFKLFTRRSVSPTSFALTEDNIVGELSYMVPGIRETANIARASYLMEQATDSEVPWTGDQVVFPRPTDTNTMLTADNGFEVMRELELPFTTNKYTAEQIAAVELQESRDLLTVELTATEAALQLEVGDVVPVTHSSPGWSAKSFWVDAHVLEPATGLVRLALHEYNASAYTLPGQGTFDPAPNSDLPDPSVCQPPTGVSMLADATTAARLPDGRYGNRILVEWTPPTSEPYLNHYLFFAGKVGGDINTYGPALNGDTFFYIGPCPSDETWQVQMVAVNQLGIISAVTPASPLTQALPNLNVETSGANLILNGDGQQGALGAAAPSWATGAGTGAVIADDQVKFSDRSLKINNTGAAAHSYSTQAVATALTLGKVYRLSGWVYQGALGGSGSYGAGFMIYVTGGGATGLLRVLEIVAPDANVAVGEVTTEAFIGLDRATNDSTWHFLTITVTVSNTGGGLAAAISQGWSTDTASGATWYDGLRVEEVDTLSDGRWRPMVEQGNKGSLQTSATPPLTSSNPVNIASIAIASHSVQYHFGTVSYNSGTINGLGQNQLHYVYADDPDYEGGAVTYASSQTRGTAVNTKGRYLVGTIITALNGGADTTGDFGAGGGQITEIAP